MTYAESCLECYRREIVHARQWIASAQTRAKKAYYLAYMGRFRRQIAEIKQHIADAAQDAADNARYEATRCVAGCGESRIEGDEYCPACRGALEYDAAMDSAA